jgi:hydrogenase-4 component B
MRGPMLGLAAACVAIGLAPVVVWPALARAVGAWAPNWSDAPAPASLPLLGGVHLALALLAAGAAVWLWRRIRSGAARRAPTWDCGYAQPTARMQYTAGSFAATIVEWFEGVLRPVRHERRPEELFPVHAAAESHTPETVLELLVVPAGRVVMRLSAAARRWQHGRLQSYLFYLLVALAALAALVTSESGQ